MSGYDPMEELSTSLDSIEEKRKDRTISVPPPPIDDFTAEVERPASSDDRLDDAPVEPSAEPVDVERATLALPSRSRGRGKGLAIRRPNGSMKAISADLPAHLVETVTELRLDADVEGRSFKLTELFSAALLDLPSKPSAVAALVDRYSSQFNYGRTSRDEGFLDETRFSTQITPDADKHVSTIVRAVYKEYGAKLARKDLYAIALLKAVAGRR